MLRIVQETGFTAEETQQVYAGLLSADPPDLPRNFQPLTLALRDTNGSVVGALMAGTLWQWLAIDVLWVAEPFRGTGHGVALMQKAESIARERGCTQARVDTFDFQALGFYEKLGYTVYGALDGLPAGHVQYHLRKDLAGSG